MSGPFEWNGMVIWDLANALGRHPNGEPYWLPYTRIVRAHLYPHFGSPPRPGSRTLRHGEWFTAIQVPEGMPDPLNAGPGDYLLLPGSAPVPAAAVSCLFILLSFAYGQLSSYIQHISLYSNSSFLLLFLSFSLSPPLQMVPCPLSFAHSHPSSIPSHRHIPGWARAQVPSRVSRSQTWRYVPRAIEAASSFTIGRIRNSASHRLGEWVTATRMVPTAWPGGGSATDRKRAASLQKVFK